MSKSLLRIVAVAVLSALVLPMNLSEAFASGQPLFVCSPSLINQEAMSGRGYFQHSLKPWFSSPGQASRVRFNPKIRNIFSPEDIGPVRSLHSSDEHLGESFADGSRFLQFVYRAMPHAQKIFKVGDLIYKTAKKLDHPDATISYDQLSDTEKALAHLRFLPRNGQEENRFSGNHDPDMKILADKGVMIDGTRLFRMMIYEEDGVRIMVLHGDEHDGIDRREGSLVRSAPGSSVHPYIRRMDYVLRRLTNACGLPPSLSIVRIWRALYRPLREYEERFIREVTALAKENGAEVVVTGHVHMPRIQVVNDVLYCNMGSWSELDPVVLIQNLNGFWELLRWRTGRRTKFEPVPAPEPMSPDQLMETLWNRFNAPALPPQEIVLHPEKYLPGIRNYALVQKKFEPHFRNYLSATGRSLSPEAAGVLDRFLARPELLEMKPRQVEEIVYEFIHASLGIWNPLRTSKAIAHQAALEELDWLYAQLPPPADPRERLSKAIELAVCGNRMGSSEFLKASQRGIEAFRTLFRSWRQEPVPFKSDNRQDLLDDLQAGPKNVLYFMDNVVEDVFQLPLINAMLDQGHPVTLVTKAKEADNDVTLEDMTSLLKDPAVAARLSAYQKSGKLKVITSGSTSRGTDLRRATLELINAWKAADVILASGEGTSGSLTSAGGLTKGFYRLLFAKEAHESDIPVGMGSVEWISPVPPADPDLRQSDKTSGAIEILDGSLIPNAKVLAIDWNGTLFDEENKCLFPETLNFLRQLKRRLPGVEIYVISNGRKSSFGAQLDSPKVTPEEREELKTLITGFIAREEGEPKSPGLKRGYLNNLLHTKGLLEARHQLITIGDSENDIEDGRSAGVVTIALVRKESEKQKLLAKHPHALVTGFEFPDPIIDYMQGRFPSSPISADLHTDVASAKIGIAAFLSFMESLPLSLQERIRTEQRGTWLNILLPLYAGITSSASGYLLRTLSNDDLSILIRSIETNPDFRAVATPHDRSAYQLVNLNAAERIIKNNPEVFQEAQNNPRQWMLDPKGWVPPHEESLEAQRYGLLSGFPPSAVALYPAYTRAKAKLEANAERVNTVMSLEDQSVLHPHKQKTLIVEQNLARFLERLGFLSPMEVDALSRAYSCIGNALKGFAAFSADDQVWADALTKIYAQALYESGFGKLLHNTWVEPPRPFPATSS